MRSSAIASAYFFERPEENRFYPIPNIQIELSDRSGRPANVAELELAASLPSANVGPLRYPAHPLARGRYAVHGAQLALAGDWQLRIEARRGEFEALTTTISVPIGKAP